jgi:hypothetical protein
MPAKAGIQIRFESALTQTLDSRFGPRLIRPLADAGE